MARPDPAQAHDELAADLVRQVTLRLVDPLLVLLQDEDALAELNGRVRIDAEMWAAQLLGRDQRQATTTAARLVGALYPSDEPFDPPPQWWTSPFGQAVLHWIGDPTRERLTYARAAAMLGITRQGVHDLLARRKLRPHADGGVTTESVRERSIERNSAERRVGGGLRWPPR